MLTPRRQSEGAVLEHRAGNRSPDGLHRTSLYTLLFLAGVPAHRWGGHSLNVCGGERQLRTWVKSPKEDNVLRKDSGFLFSVWGKRTETGADILHQKNSQFYEIVKLRKGPIVLYSDLITLTTISWVLRTPTMTGWLSNWDDSMVMVLAAKRPGTWIHPFIQSFYHASGPSKHVCLILVLIKTWSSGLIDTSARLSRVVCRLMFLFQKPDLK